MENDNWLDAKGNLFVRGAQVAWAQRQGNTAHLRFGTLLGPNRDGYGHRVYDIQTDKGRVIQRPYLEVVLIQVPA